MKKPDFTHFSISEIEIDRFGVANVQDSVRLWRKSSDHFTASLFQVLGEEIHSLIG